MARIIVMMILTGFLAACERETVSHSRYICAGNMWLDTTFRDGKVVEIKTEGDVYTLSRVASESGAKYEANGLVFESKGKDAKFTEKKGTEPISCQRR